MSSQWQRHVRVGVNREGVVDRRDFLRYVSAASLAAGALSWTDLVQLRADELGKRGMSCILLWMQGGPSQFETFSPKPDHENGGETKAITTSVPGIQIAERFPHLATVTDQLAIIRSMTTKEGNHQRASFLLHTSYPPSPSVKYPAMGAVAAQELANSACELPAFVRIGGRFRNAGGGGLLGVQFDPFQLQSAGRPPENTKPATNVDRYQRRLGLLRTLESDYAAAGAQTRVEDHRKLYDKASRMILSSQMKAFSLDEEADEMRDAYGRTEFGNGCLLARRLVETGVTFVEVSLGNWDTHADNQDRTRKLAEQCDQPFAQLLRDLDQRGMLDTTLVVWMGEFGRTPRINARCGRDHYPKAFNVALAGAGVRGGQVIGETDAGGAEITDRPVSVEDLFQSIYTCLKIDPETENISPIGRPVKLVEGGEPVAQLFG